MFSSRYNTEKRDYMRMALDCPVSYSDLEGLRTRQGHCINLSAKGIAFEAAESFPLGAELTVSLIPKLSMTPPFSAKIKIVRAERNSIKHNYTLAGMIEEVI